MVYFGHIKNGKIVTDAEAHLPEGTRVRIEPVESAPDPAADLSVEAVDLGVSDMSEQHDHYAYGSPKRPPERK